MVTALIRLGPLDNPPPSMTNAERLQSYRARIEPVIGNNYPWPHVERERYAREAMAAAPDPDEYREAFDFKYGPTQGTG